MFALLSLKEEDRLTAVLGRRGYPPHRVCHISGEMICDVRKPKCDIGHVHPRCPSDLLGGLTFWRKQDQHHPLFEGREGVVENPGPLVVVLEDVSHEDPRDAAAVRDEINDVVANGRRASVDASVPFRRDQRPKPARAATPVLGKGAMGKPCRSDLVARCLAVWLRLLETTIPVHPLPDIRHESASTWRNATAMGMPRQEVGSV
jgi:hypothetical protein